MFKSSPKLSDIESLRESAGKMHFQSRYRFLQATNGIRPGCIHGLLAPTSMGKSTLVRSIIADTSELCRVGVILSEESPLEYSSGFIGQKENINWDNVKYAIESEIVSVFKSKEEQIEAIVSFAIENDLVVLFWDNITTGSILGDSVRPEKMAMLLDLLKKRLLENNIALFFVAHTNKTVKTEQNHQFQGEDVRGSAQYYMKSDYFYTLQTKTKNDEKVTFLKIAKHRFHQVKNEYYILEFLVSRYSRDIGVQYSKIQEIFEKEVKNEKSAKPNRSYPDRYV